MAGACPGEGPGGPDPPLLVQNIHLYCPRRHPSDAWKSHLRGKISKILLKHAGTTVKSKLNTGLSPLSVSIGLSHGSFKP